MEKGDYALDNFYSKGPGEFEPSEDIPQTGYEIRSGELGMTLDPRSANQLAALSTSLNSGAIPIEIGALQPETFETIPIQHFTEMKRKAKLAEAKLSLHAPLIDPTGMTQQGWDEGQQMAAERQLINVMDKAAMLDDKHNVPVTIHSSNYAGSVYKFQINSETGERERVAEQIIAIDREKGQLVPLKQEVKYHPGGEQIERTISPEDYLRIANNSQWDDEINKVLFHKESADRILKVLPKEAFLLAQQARNPEFYKGLGPTERKVIMDTTIANAHLEDASLALNGAFNKAYKYAKNDKEKDALKEFSKEYGKAIYGGVEIDRIKGRDLTSKEEEKYFEAISDLPSQADSIQMFAERLKRFHPVLLQTVEDFAIEKAADTLSHVAMHNYNTYEKKGKLAPIISVENLYPGMAFSQAEDLKGLIENTQSKFANELVKNENISEKKALQVAEKLIGVTWDVGHSNIHKKHGFTDEDIAAEAKMIAKHVKHVHITDNFGYSDSHLPQGMGNVPTKAIMEALGESGAKARKINEVGGWFEHFKTNPFAQILESFGSPIYSSGEGPYWSQRTGFQQNYQGGYGQMLPSINYETFGAGFSRLPQELGGSTQQGTGGRMGGGSE